MSTPKSRFSEPVSHLNNIGKHYGGVILMKKSCSRCGKVYPVTAQYFHRSSDSGDGFRAKCKVCRSEQYNNPIGVELTCCYCGKKYIPKSKERDLYCTRECYFKVIEKKCKTCGVSLRGTNKKDYCSAECQPDRQKPYFTCVACGEIKEGWAGQKYCSGECLRKVNRKRFKIYAVNQHKPKKFICKECGKEHSPEYGDKSRVFCSRECMNKHGKRVAKATRNARLRGCVNWRRIDPIEILKRDNWTCQLCGIKTPKKHRGTIKDNAPEVDHIVPLSLGGSHIATNLQCLCRKCNIEKGATVHGQLRIC